jgi:hypothetical protein
MEQYVINLAEYIIDDSLQGFEICQKPSSNVDFYGTNGKDIFIQFKNGGTYIYENVPKEIIDEMHKAESIGSFVSKYLTKKFEFKKFDNKLVNSKPQQ